MAPRGPALDKTGLAADLPWLRSHYTTAHSLCSPGIWLRGSVFLLPPRTCADFVLRCWTLCLQLCLLPSTSRGRVCLIAISASQPVSLALSFCAYCRSSESFILAFNQGVCEQCGAATTRSFKKFYLFQVSVSCIGRICHPANPSDVDVNRPATCTFCIAARFVGVSEETWRAQLTVGS